MKQRNYCFIISCLLTCFNLTFRWYTEAIIENCSRNKIKHLILQSSLLKLIKSWTLSFVFFKEFSQILSNFLFLLAFRDTFQRLLLYLLWSLFINSIITYFIKPKIQIRNITFYRVFFHVSDVSTAGRNHAAKKLSHRKLFYK